MQLLYINSVVDAAAPQSHLPSFHPVLHLSSHFLQSNSCFPSFLLTSLCASHIHLPKPSRPSTLGSFPFLAIHSWKSSAHTQHGYSFPNRPRNWRISLCCDGEARGGYDADMVCSSVHVLRPNSSTSGGQSGGGARAAVATDGGVDFSVVVIDDASLAMLFFINAAQSAEEVQERQLKFPSQHQSSEVPRSIRHERLAIFSENYTLWYFRRRIISFMLSRRLRLAMCVLDGIREDFVHTLRARIVDLCRCFLLLLVLIGQRLTQRASGLMSSVPDCHDPWAVVGTRYNT